MRAVNLLPSETAQRRRKRPTVVVQLAVVSPFVIGSLLAAGYLLASSKVNDKKATLQALQDQLAALPAPAAEPQIAPELALQRDLRISALGPPLQARLAWDRILREISSVLPGDVWLTTLSAQSPQIAAAPAPLPSTTTTTTTTSSSDTTATPPAPIPAPVATAPLKIVGYTYSQEGVARLLSRLEVIPELQDVKLIQSAQTNILGQDVVSFEIQASVRPPVVSS
jgi:Tfp pilus assembly protein PilN